MKQITINPNNKRFYSEDFIKGFECGTKRQLEADKADRPQGEWIDVNGDGSLWRCDQCKDTACCKGNFCPNCGARMKGASNGEDIQSTDE